MATTSTSAEAIAEQWFPSMAEIYQAAGMLTVELGVTITDALTHLHDHAIDAGRSVNEVARDVIARRTRT